MQFCSCFSILGVNCLYMLGAVVAYDMTGSLWALAATGLAAFNVVAAGVGLLGRE